MELTNNTEKELTSEYARGKGITILWNPYWHSMYQASISLSELSSFIPVVIRVDYVRRALHKA